MKPEAEGVYVIIKAINTHIDNVDVCMNGCGALSVMTFDNSTFF